MLKIKVKNNDHGICHAKPKQILYRNVIVKQVSISMGIMSCGVILGVLEEGAHSNMLLWMPLSGAVVAQW